MHSQDAGRRDFLWQIVYKQKKGWMDGCNGADWRNARLLTEPFTKIAVFRAQSNSEYASASTRLLPQPETHRKLLISLRDPGLPRPTRAKTLVTQSE